MKQTALVGDHTLEITLQSEFLREDHGWNSIFNCKVFKALGYIINLDIWILQVDMPLRPYLGVYVLPGNWYIFQPGIGEGVFHNFNEPCCITNESLVLPPFPAQ